MLTVNEVFNDHYRIDKVLGSGGMGKVYLATDIRDESRWAIKEQLITDLNRELLISEADIMGKVFHPAFPKLKEKLVVEDILYLIMEYIEGVTLENVIEKKDRLPEGQVIDYFKQVADALHYLHNLDVPVVYRDFKPSNIMLEPNGKIRVIDLGIAQEYSGAGAQVDVAVLTRGYAAPEQYNKRYKLDERTDIYALGVTVHYLITGKDPNKPPHEFVPIRKLRRDASYALEYIIKKCLQPNPDRRYKDAGFLLADLNRIEKLDQEIKAKVRIRKTIVTISAALIVVISLIVYFTNLRVQTNEISEYYDHIENALAADSLASAISEIQSAIDLAPDNPDAYILYAEEYANNGNLDEAYKFINETIIPKFPDIYSNADFISLIQKIEALQ